MSRERLVEKWQQNPSSASEINALRTVSVRNEYCGGTMQILISENFLSSCTKV
jgi:hypothetical protein